MAWPGLASTMATPPPEAGIFGLTLSEEASSVVSETAFRATTSRSVSCVSWAEDGRLAVATSRGVCILALRVSREGAYEEGGLEVRQQWASRGEVARVAWSRPGAAWDGRCLLCATWLDGVATIHEPPRPTSGFEWPVVQTLDRAKYTDAAWGPRLALSSEEGIDVWDGASAKRLSSPAASASAWASDETLLVGTTDGRLCRSGETLREADGRYVHLVAAIGEATALAAASASLAVVFLASNAVVSLPRPDARPVASVAGDDSVACACSTNGDICVWALPTCDLVARRPEGPTFGLAISPSHLCCARLDRVPVDAVKRQEAGLTLRIVSRLRGTLTFPRDAPAERNDDFLWVGPWAAKRRLDRKIERLDDGLDHTALGHVGDPHLAHLLAALLPAPDALAAARSRFLANRDLDRLPPCPVCDAPIRASSLSLRPTCDAGHPVLLCALSLRPIPLDSERLVCPGCRVSLARNHDLPRALCPFCRVYCDPPLS